MSVNDLTKQAEQLFSKTCFFGEKNYGNYAASIRARCVDGGGGLVHHSLLCRPPRHLQRRKVLLLIIFMVKFAVFDHLCHLCLIELGIHFYQSLLCQPLICNGVMEIQTLIKMTRKRFQELKRLGLLWDRRSSSDPE